MAVCLHFSTDHALEKSMKISMWKFRSSVFEFLQLVDICFSLFCAFIIDLGPTGHLNCLVNLVFKSCAIVFNLWIAISLH